MSRQDEKRAYRYPGVVPFTMEQSQVFFGREQDVDDFYRIIRHESPVVLYSKSGFGKSSLLNAGIIPRCIQDGAFTPIYIRFGVWTEAREITPLSVTRNAIVKHGGIPTFLEGLLPNDVSLWFQAKNRQLQGDTRLLLLFDQFEELFTYPPEEVLAFQQELAELSTTAIPLRFRRMLEEYDGSEVMDEEEERMEEPLHTGIVFAIRSDRMHLLDRLKCFLPNVLRHCFELKALTRDGARDAIVRPAAASGDFGTDAFQFSEIAVQKLLDFLQEGPDGRIEGILLQMLCENYERKIVKDLGLTFVELERIGDPNEVVKNYYEEKIDALPAARQEAARHVIEDGLVSEGEAMRLSLHEAFIIQEYKVDKELLELLVEMRLLRSEPFLRGGYTYELSHDRLIPPVLYARTRRKEVEALQKAERKERERKNEEQRIRAQAERDRIDKEKAQKQLLIVRGLLLLSVLVTLVTTGGIYFAMQQRNLAKARQLDAENAQKATQRALNDFRSEQAAKELLIFTDLEERSAVILEDGGCPPPQFLADLRRIAKNHIDSTRLCERIKNLEAKNPNCL